MAKESVAERFGAGSTTIAAGATLAFNRVAGQMGIYFRYLAGATLEIGGASLVSGSGLVLGTSPATVPVFIPMSDAISVACTGTTTCTFTYLRLFSEGSTGTQG